MQPHEKEPLSVNGQSHTEHMQGRKQPAAMMPRRAVAGA